MAIKAPGMIILIMDKQRTLSWDYTGKCVLICRAIARTIHHDA